MLFTACSNEEEFGTKADFSQREISNLGAIKIDGDGYLPDSLLHSLIINNPELYSSDESNSDLWIDEQKSGTRASGVTYKVYGYDEEKYVNDYKTYFSSGLAWDSRVASFTNMVFIANIRLYVKYVRIPKGVTLVVPPQSVLNNLTNIGRHPIGSSLTSPIIHGYTHKYYSTSGTEDIYELRTEAVTVQYNIEGKQIFYNPPVYMPEKAKNGPSTFEFWYQYIDINW